MDDARERDRRIEIAHTWARVLDPTAYVPMSRAEREEFLLDLVNRVLDGLAAEPFSARVAAEVGARLVDAHFTGPDSLPRTVEVLAAALLSESGTLPEVPGKVMALLGQLTGGYVGAMRMNTLDQQEQLNRALVRANWQVSTKLRATENRFHEVFTSSAVGIAITDLAGGFAEVNPALADILGCQPEDLAGRRLSDFFVKGAEPVDLLEHDEDGALDRADRIRQRRQLSRGNGEIAWVYVATSVLHDGTDSPAYCVTVVQDLSELQLLQGQLGHQLLHDSLTGLANRQHFTSKLESTLEGAGPGQSITLCCLGLDAFSVVNNGHGLETGDRLLLEVGHRLRAVVIEERALVARVGGDEFAILIEDSANTPDIPELVRRINAELLEPIFIDGHGISVGASVGAIRSLASRTSGAEMFRAANAALRSAKATGARQWVHFDPHQDTALRRANLRATELAAAWENGELELSYRPVVRLPDRRPAAVRAVLTWCRSELPPEPCLDLAERIGLSVPLTSWILTRACEQLPAWQRLFHVNDGKTAAVQRIRLTRLQSSDADLSAAVNAAIEATGVPPGSLEIAFDTAALLADHGDAQDNLQVLADIGVATALHGFGGGSRELALLDSSPARSVILANPVAEGANLPAPGSLAARAIERLALELRQAAVTVGVDGVRNTAEATWWNDLGVQLASGPAFGEPGAAGEIELRIGAVVKDH